MYHLLVAYLGLHNVLRQDFANRVGIEKAFAVQIQQWA
jgi:hypothetical protein